VGATTVTFSSTPLAFAGTIAPVTSSFRETPDWNSPLRPRPVRVSSIRVGSTAITEDGTPVAA
jgi:hypothetical protein